MFDAECDLAALVYGPGQDPDRILSGFAADLHASGHLAVGLVQLGHRRFDSVLCATLLHSGENMSLFRDSDDPAGGRRLDLDRLRDAGERIAAAIERGADIVIVNRFGRQECEGKGLSPLIAHALRADIPVVIAVPGHRFADWIRFAQGMSVKLPCNRLALDAWWQSISTLGTARGHPHQTICDLAK
jgi:hypothetical protein